jgi:hypothetical protein
VIEVEKEDTEDATIITPTDTEAVVRREVMKAIRDEEPTTRRRIANAVVDGNADDQEIKIMMRVQVVETMEKGIMIDLRVAAQEGTLKGMKMRLRRDIGIDHVALHHPTEMISQIGDDSVAFGLG